MEELFALFFSNKFRTVFDPFQIGFGNAVQDPAFLLLANAPILYGKQDVMAELAGQQGKKEGYGGCFLQRIPKEGIK